ncbi:MAG: hypothetical protein IJX98_06915 [Clostridia bacterium]|nr:hypothetical protein [Clostridia bacterium]
MPDEQRQSEELTGKKTPKQDELDTTTTFADMNVDGMPWYNPNRKGKGENKGEKLRLTAAEKWAMFKAGFSVILPYILMIGIVFGVMYLLAYLWLM